MARQLHARLSHWSSKSFLEQTQSKTKSSAWCSPAVLLGSREAHVVVVLHNECAWCAVEVARVLVSAHAALLSRVNNEALRHRSQVMKRYHVTRVNSASSGRGVAQAAELFVASLGPTISGIERPHEGLSGVTGRWGGYPARLEKATEVDSCLMKRRCADNAKDGRSTSHTGRYFRA